MLLSLFLLRLVFLVDGVVTSDGVDLTVTVTLVVIEADQTDSQQRLIYSNKH